jgi:hypothetical protein
MSEQYELHISWKGEEFPAIILFGDSRGTAFNSDKMVLTNLDGWDAPIYRKRITIEDPNGGVYADPVTTATQKLVTINMSIFHKNNIDSWPLIQQVKSLTDLDDFLELKLISIFDNEFKVVEILDNCYFVNAPTYEKKFGEHRFVMVFGSKDYDFKSVTTETIEPPVDVPEPGEAGYEGQTDGEIGIGEQDGKVWNEAQQAWVEPATTGLYLGEPSTASSPGGTGFFWDGEAWVATDPTTDPAYHAGVNYGDLGTESFNLGLRWEPRSSKWWNFPIDIRKLDTTGYEKMFGNWMWTIYRGLQIRGYYDAQNDILDWEDPKAIPEYHDGTVHREKGTESWNSKLWWNTNPMSPGWQNTDPGIDLGPRDGSDGTYHGEFRARSTSGDNVFWDSGMRAWSSYDPRTDPSYVAGTVDKEMWWSPFGELYWNIEINAYQNSDEFFISRGEMPTNQSDHPGNWHGEEAVGENLFWDSMNQVWSGYNWTTDPTYVAGNYDGEHCWETFAYNLYWNQDIGFYQTDQEYANMKGYMP